MNITAQSVATDDGLELRLGRVTPVGAASRSSVLLLHGANTNGDSFLLPGTGLAGWLARLGHDVWILEWRGSSEIVERYKTSHHDAFDLDRVAKNDIPAALRAMKNAQAAAQLSIVGHCLGGAATAMALGSGQLEPFAIRRVVFIAAGLFLSAPVESQLKAHDGALERAASDNPTHPGVDPNRVDEWPAEIKRVSDMWPRSSLPRGDARSDAVYRRAAVMYGRPYRRSLVSDEVHHQAHRLFGLLHLGLYRHAVQCLRRGYVAPLDSPEEGPEAWAAAQPYFRPDGFRGKELLLLTGRHNDLWHPDSLSRFDEWLRCEANTRPTREVLADYGHQDLLWGRDAHRDVYPLIQQALPSAIEPSPHG